LYFEIQNPRSAATQASPERAARACGLFVERFNIKTAQQISFKDHYTRELCRNETKTDTPGGFTGI
jgi:hypothetical protein